VEAAGAYPWPEGEGWCRMTLLKDLIRIPESVHKGDFVMSLAGGVADSAATLENYVVTPQLGDAYDNALRFIASAINENKSKAAYLDGSFGSGKSHFMAVLHLLLQRNSAARAIPELGEAIAASDGTLSKCSFALVPFHMIGAESMEQAIFGGYVKYVRDTDPTATLPGVYADDPLFEQAEFERSRLGDEAFFAALNAGQPSSGGEWGELEASWDATSYEQARTAPAGDPNRGRLGGTIVTRFMPGYVKALSGNAEGYVDLDTGLAELARHARDRGHQGLILFLDELILWLGSRIRDTAFVEREGQKLIKLIEFTTTRPIPIVSFVARQRDLREFVGDEMPGADKLSFADALKHWNDRFHRISLADRNLPKIAERRLLRPKGEAERLQIDAAFAQTEKTNPQILDVLMTEEGDRELFRATYPFSPAFMATLVAASSVLQRERTALRVMLQLLVDRRNELTVGDLVSVGDLFDVLAGGDEPFSDDMKRQFDHARDVYRDHFRPLLLEAHKISESDADKLEPTHPFRADDRLVKTLLLAALVPGAGPLKSLDVAKLTALNHGSIVSPIPGGEKGIVLSKLRAWSSQVGALKVGEDPQNPTVALRLTGVDVDSVIAKAAHVDNVGERRRLIKTLVLDELGVETDQRLFSEHPIIWRGTQRTVDVVFGNVRDTSDLPDDTLRASGGRWKIVVDYPFDQGHTPLDDLDRLERWRSDYGQTDTVCWIPAFFSASLQRDLAKLVVITHILGGDRLDTFAEHLSHADRVQARGLLSDQRSALEQRVRTAIRQAYGVERVAPETIDTSHGIDDRIQSLRPGLVAQIPIGATLGDAFNGLLEQLFDHQYPKHPRIGMPYRPANLRMVLEETLRAVAHPDGRIEVPSDRRKVMRAIATPLELGIQHEAPFVLGLKWKDHFDRAIAAAQQQGQSEITVGDLRRWFDVPDPLGLPRDLQSLVILVYAAQTGRVFHQHGGPADPTLDKLEDDLELVSPQLPDEHSWDVARGRASSVLGIADVNPSLRSFETLVATLRTRGQTVLPSIEALLPILEKRAADFAVELDSNPRMRSAQIAHELARGLVDPADSITVIERLAALEIPSEPHVGTALASADTVRMALDGERWTLLGVAIDRASAGEPGFVEVVTSLRNALATDEFAAQLEPAVAKAYADAVKLIGATAPPPPTPPPVAPPPPGVSVSRGEKSGLDIDEARTELDQLSTEEGEVQVDLRWTITTKSHDA
jgi:hypothetical protein